MKKVLNDSTIRQLTSQLSILAKQNKSKQFMTVVHQQKIIGSLDQFSPYCLSNTISSFHKIGVRNSNMWDLLSKHFYNKLEGMAVGDI